MLFGLAEEPAHILRKFLFRVARMNGKRKPTGDVQPLSLPQESPSAHVKFLFSFHQMPHCSTNRPAHQVSGYVSLFRPEGLS